MAYIDNGDGTITVNGFKIAKPFGMQQPKQMAPPSPMPMSPEIAAAAAPGPDMRTAETASFEVPGLAMPGGQPWQPKRSTGPAAPTTAPDAGTAAFLQSISEKSGVQPKSGTSFAPPETTVLAPGKEAEFQRWVKKNGIRDADNPDAHYDYRGAFEAGLKPGEDHHWPDTFKQHGHPTFSNESQYSNGDGGSWDPNGNYVPPGKGAPAGPSGAPSGPRIISPGGMRTVAESTQKGVPIPEDLKQERDDAVLGQRAANQSGYLAQAAEQEQSGVAARQYADETQRRLAEEQQRAVQHKDTLASAQQKLEQMQSDYRSKPVNEDAYWQEKGSGAKMAAGVWVTLGLLAQRMGGQGTENVAKNQIDKQVDSWVADQKERRGIALQGQQTALANVRQNFESESAQNAALRSQAYDAYRAKLGAIVGENAPEKLKAQANQLDQELAQKSTDWKIQAAQAEADHVTTQSRLVGPTVAGGGGAKALDRGLVVQDINGEKYLARDAEQARDLNKKHALTKTAIDAADTMRRISEKSATEKLDPNSPSGKEFGFAREQFTNSMNALAEQGVVRGDDIKRYEEYTGSAYGLSTAEAAKKLASKAGTAYSYNLSAKADTESPLDEEFGAGPGGTVDKYAHYRMAQGPNGSQLPIAVPGGGRRKKKGVTFTPLGQ